VRFTLGEETLEATAGQIVVIPAGTPHKFASTGAGDSAKSASTRQSGWRLSGSSDEQCASSF
jgi:mannose-6-phosphate isomerase-like protein (cupin superfamily)